MNQTKSPKKTRLARAKVGHKLIHPKEYFSSIYLLIFALVFGAIGGYILLHSFAAPNPNLAGDLNNDNTVSILDLSMLLSNYNTTSAVADINNDGSVNVFDLSILLSHYGQSVASSGVIPPTAPSAYSLPGSAVTVSSASALQTALNGSTTDIILTNGTYTNGTYMTIGSHRLWAQNLGGATLNFGLVMGGNSGSGDPEVHGLRFNVTDPNLAFQSDIINIWGTGTGAVIEDSWISGNNVLDAGVEARVTSGLTIHRVVVDGFQSYGINFETYYPNYYTDVPAVEPIISDVDISSVSRSPAGSSNGTAEAGLWVGTNCLCSNIKVRGAGWMGIWLGGNANNGVYSNFDIDQSGSFAVGVYLEHFSRGNLFKNFIIGGSTGGAGIRVGFNCEWADPAYTGQNPVAGQSISACHNNTFQNGTIYSNYDGLTLEDAENTTISNITFFDQSRSAIDDFMTAGSGQTTTWQNQGNNFAGIKSGAVQYSTAH